MHIDKGLAYKLSVASLAGTLGLMAAFTQPGIAQENANPAPTAPADGALGNDTAGDATAADDNAPDAGQETMVSFPPAQMRQGNLAYQANCASCHGDRLGGYLENPALQSEEFRSHWWGLPVSSLYDYISLYMPLDRPGALMPEEYANILAFILNKNGIEPTEDAEPIPGDSAALMDVMLPELSTDETAEDESASAAQ